ncbi:hypothetical protein BCR34DRAFT_599781 [Clohesyomyces aquaticus]|uniref:Rhodopsin domain-containing protein n=1 Tax=Clohesyomyces aquaticus TaxID=1231657 RepID=A0A1Y1ZTQ3_9PLEO|nr:hypothetical protein BCR34DRAFT_599781 [Clohesyomyces aquaticus]
MDASFVSTSLLSVAISLPVFATISVTLRFLARRVNGTQRLRGDDWTILLSLVSTLHLVERELTVNKLLCWGHSVNTIVAGAIGGIDRITMPPREYADIALRTLWTSGFFLITSLYTVKISILLFYHHLFSVDERFRMAIRISVATLSAWWISSLCQTLATDPIEASWKNAARAGHRFDFNAWYISYSGLSIFFDVAVLCLPIPMIKSLHVSTRKKISILGIFWLGGFVCVSATIRFVLLYRSIYRLTSLGQNQYSSVTKAFIWAEVEPNASVIAACLPTYGPFFSETGIVSSFIRSLRSAWYTSTGSRKGVRGSNVARSQSSGYYELDRSNSGKGAHGESVVRKMEVESEQDRGEDWVQKDIGVPKAFDPF